MSFLIRKCCCPYQYMLRPCTDISYPIPCPGGSTIYISSSEEAALNSSVGKVIKIDGICYTVLKSFTSETETPLGTIQQTGCEDCSECCDGSICEEQYPLTPCVELSTGCTQCSAGTQPEYYTIEFEDIKCNWTDNNATTGYWWWDSPTWPGISTHPTFGFTTAIQHSSTCNWSWNGDISSEIGHQLWYKRYAGDTGVKVTDFYFTLVAAAGSYTVNIEAWSPSPVKVIPIFYDVVAHSSGDCLDEASGTNDWYKYWDHSNGEAGANGTVEITAGDIYSTTSNCPGGSTIYVSEDSAISAQVGKSIQWGGVCWSVGSLITAVNPETPFTGTWTPYDECSDCCV